MKKVKEKDVRILEWFCIITAVTAGILSGLYLFDVLQNHWFLNFILILAILLHVSLVLLFLIRKKKVFTLLAAAFVVLYAFALISLNFL